MQLYLDSCVLIYALVRMECLVGPLRSADQMRLQAFRSSHDPQGPDPQGPDPGGQHRGQPLNRGIPEVMVWPVSPV